MPTNKKGYIHAYYHRERAKIIRALGGKCLKCGCSEYLEIHHVNNGHKEICSGAGQLTRLCEWKANLDNLALLCSEHHQEYHAIVRNNVNLSTLTDYIRSEQEERNHHYPDVVYNPGGV